MNTLNYWLGKLQRLQLFGHGIKEFIVVNETTERFYRILAVEEIDGKVYLKIRE